MYTDVYGRTTFTLPVVENSKGTISYDEARLVRANVQRKTNPP